jgi:hypothetical protein
MAAEDFSALHKVAYGEGVPELVPDLALVQKDVKFSESALMGDYFEQAVRLSLPGGFTRQVGDGTAGAFTLAGATAGTQKKAKVYGYQLILQDQIPYEDLSKAAKGGAQAYKKATALFWEGMQLSMRKMLEANLLYGQKGIGVVSAYSASNAGYSNQPTITISESDWAPQLWAGYEGTILSGMNGSTSTERGEAAIVSVDIDNRVVVLSATIASTAAGDVIYYKDGYGVEMYGLDYILSNTGALFNINAGTYANWQSARHAVGGAFSFQALKKGLSKGSAKGLMGNMIVYCSDGGFDDLVGDIHQLRTVDKSEVRRIELGQDEVVYKRGGVTAVIKPHAMVKNKHAMGIPAEMAKRVGSADFKFGIPGQEDKIWFDLETKAGKEGRAYTHQAIFLEQPGVAVQWTGITNRAT